MNRSPSADRNFLQLAIEKARESVMQGGFPAGAIVVKNAKIVGEGISIGNKLNDPSGHGELSAIRKACANLHVADLLGSVLYTSVEPCLMCFGGSMWSGISRIVYACAKEKVSPQYYGGQYHVAEINGGLLHPIELVHFQELEDESLYIIRDWEKSLS